MFPLSLQAKSSIASIAVVRNPGLCELFPTLSRPRKRRAETALRPGRSSRRARATLSLRPGADRKLLTMDPFAVLQAVNWLANLGVGLVFLPLRDALARGSGGTGTVFWIFTAATGLGVLVTGRLLQR
jgi:hypothetical protein